MSKTVILDTEAFEELNVRFNAVHMYIDTATDYAQNADSVFVDSGSCNALKNKMTRGIDNIISTSQMINERFNSADKQATNNANEINSPTVNPGSSGNSGSSGSGGGSSSGSAISGNAYQQATTSQNISNYRGIVQPNDYDCTSCASTTMLQRWLVMNGKGDIATGLSFQNVKAQMGNIWHITPKNPITYEGTSFRLKGVGNCDNNGANDFLKQKSPSGNSQEGLANLLMEHPEGIVFYSHYTDGRNADGWSNPHAITITRFTRNEDGSYQFYAQDPALSSAGGAEVRLEDTWLYSLHKSYYQNSIDTMLNRGISIQYIESVQQS